LGEVNEVPGFPPTPVKDKEKNEKRDKENYLFSFKYIFVFNHGLILHKKFINFNASGGPPFCKKVGPKTFGLHGPLIVLHFLKVSQINRSFWRSRNLFQKGSWPPEAS